MNNWQTSSFNSSDGINLFYRFHNKDTDNKTVLLFLHRGHEHSGRIVEIADQISAQYYSCYAFDLRGHGRSAGPRGWAQGFDNWVDDLNSFTRHLRDIHGVDSNNIILVANSVGSVMAVSWILRYGANIKACILGAPAFSIRLYIPFALTGLRLMRQFSDHLFVTSYVKSGLLTRDENQANAYDEDELITKKIGVNVLVSLFDCVKNCFSRLKDFETPVLVLTAEKDFIVNNRWHQRFIDGISSTHKRHITLPDFRHAIFHEADREQVITHCREFIEQNKTTPTRNLPAVIPTAREHTRAEYQQLINPVSLPKRIFWQSYRWLLEKVGSKSTGVATGLQHGFDSGVSLDYIYQNSPAGENWLGKIFDRIYLGSVGWRGIRKRKRNLKKTLTFVSSRLEQHGASLRILDIASGPGRYLFEFQQASAVEVQLTLNDTDPASIAKAKIIAQEFGSDEIRFLSLDVFEQPLFESLAYRPNLIIVSGLLELYENNTQVHRLFARLYQQLDEGGYLVYTGQPWHPQIELIGRLLNNRNKQRWVMRRRVQTELDELVESAGFKKLHTAADEDGIFTVSCAIKDESIEITGEHK